MRLGKMDKDWEEKESRRRQSEKEVERKKRARGRKDGRKPGDRIKTSSAVVEVRVKDTILDRTKRLKKRQEKI